MKSFAKFLVSAAATIALVTTSVPAFAATEDISPTSSLAWLDGHATNIEFDPSGRMWVWNNAYDPGLNHNMQTNVLVKNNVGDWELSYRLRIKRFETRDISFASDGTMYAAGVRGRVCQLAVVTFNGDGSVKKSKTHSFPLKFCPLYATPTDGGKIVLVGWARRQGPVLDAAIKEYSLPFSARKRATREIKFDMGNNSDVAIGQDGAVYVTQGENMTGGVDVFTASQRGTVEPDHSFTVHPDYGEWVVGGLAFTPSGQLALKSKASVSLYPTSSSGTNLVPDTFYRFTDFAWNGDDVAFDADGVMVTADYGLSSPIRFFFETPPCGLRPEARC